MTIVLPNAIPMMITVFMFAFSWQWTDNFYTDIFFPAQLDKITLMPDIIAIPPLEPFPHQAEAAWVIVCQNTAAIMIILPLVIMYLFCQKYLVQGIERSGLVG